MSDEAEDMKKKVALAMAALTDTEVELEASAGKVRAIKRQIIANSCLVAAMASSSFRGPREAWAYARHGRWFEETLPNLGEQNFRQSFRVSQTTFKYLVDVCRPTMERQTTNMREAIPVNKRVAVALYKLCSSAEDRTIANLFDMGRSTVNIIYREFCEAVVDSLEERWVRMPTPSEMEDHIKEFQLTLGFPQGVGALDGCHFPVSPPKEYASDYYNYKGWYSVILLALVDHNYMFRFINVGSPGRCHDAHVYHQSSLSRLIEGPTFRTPKTTLGNVAVPPLVLCDQAFPLTPNLMKPFASTSCSEEQKHFNYQLSKSRRIVENAFGRLKARFRFIMKRMECDISHAPIIIRACCVLNNICEHYNDTVPQQWINEVQLHDAVFQQPAHTTDAHVATGKNIRAALAMHLRQQMAQ
ncbi:uncharacterized protein LOC119384138 [Rhipicephalus sanguineus]|uniref:uncharacterized protein LOC119384138 n=1 Tax=Rhipicephalus sanguineus TaxID=34632 RepID=UPI00189627A2|nr:uncharacterized protein LOC119384138 [Rhipicephalus sanguineus]